MQKSILTIILLIISLFVVNKIKSFIKNNPPINNTPVLDVKNIDIVATSTTLIKATIGINDNFIFNNTSIKVVSVIEDSRCSLDVTCIQAGRVRLIINVGTEATEIELGKTITIDNLNISLDDVKPNTISSHKILDGEYSFSFTINTI